MSNCNIIRVNIKITQFIKEKCIEVVIKKIK